MNLSRRIAVTDPYDLAASLFTVVGPGGNTVRRAGDRWHIATRNRAGPAQVALERSGSGIEAEAWGPGASSELEMLPRLLGLTGDADEFRPPPGPIRDLARRNRGMRFGATGKVFELLAPTILAQRITSGEAKRSYARLVRAYGEPAPGPLNLRLPPLPAALAGLAYEELHRHGIERSRAVILREAARRARRLEAIVDMSQPEAYRRLTAVRGIGAWTAGHVMAAAWGDDDAVPIGDFHLPNTVAWVLAGESRADDTRMLELLDRYRPHRRRTVALLKRSGASAPKYGPRTPVHDIRGR